MFADRKTSYKLPPTTIRDKLVSQEARRNKALAEQKRRRAQRVDSTRQLDLFAGLNLGASDEEEDEEEASSSSRLAPASVAQYASMLLQEPQDNFPSNAITSSTTQIPLTSSSVVLLPHDQHQEQQDPVELKKKQKKRKAKKRTNKPSKWADKCMYAELLEMVADEPWSNGEVADGLPNGLETGWVAVAPVPVGKRCLAVTHQSAGVAGVVPNTTLRSRLLGKTLINRFPSSLPPLTILDCILDANWRDNGILHVLDVVKWKGQDVGDCEAPFRFWWRDTRLAELSQSLPPSTSTHSNFVSVPASTPTSPTAQSEHIHPQPQTHAQTLKYHFPYPTSFIPVPYHTNTTLVALDALVVPAARAVREVNFCVPLPPTVSTMTTGTVEEPDAGLEGSMEVEHVPVQRQPHPGSSLPSFTAPFTFQAPMDDIGIGNGFSHNQGQGATPTTSTFSLSSSTDNNNASKTTKMLTAHIQPDGLLLYIAEASYEPGTNPLSSWVPICGYDDDTERSEKMVQDVSGSSSRAKTKSKEAPLDLFHRLVRRRLARRMAGTGTEGLGIFESDGELQGDVEMDI